MKEKEAKAKQEPKEKKRLSSFSIIIILLFNRMKRQVDWAVFSLFYLCCHIRWIIFHPHSYLYLQCSYSHNISLFYPINCLR